MFLTYIPGTFGLVQQVVMEVELLLFNPTALLDNLPNIILLSSIQFGVLLVVLQLGYIRLLYRSKHCFRLVTDTQLNEFDNAILHQPDTT